MERGGHSTPINRLYDSEPLMPHKPPDPTAPPQSSPQSYRQPLATIDLKPGAHIHLMGICGTAMASLAGLLKSRGFKISGSDQNVYPPMSTQLEKLGISIQQGYKKENLTPPPDLVIVGNVISTKYEEAQALLESDIPFTSLPRAMGELVIEKRHSIVVAGTHGKTTTTSMNAFIAEDLGLKPGFMIGGIPKNFDLSFRSPSGDYFVIEGDEYDTAFFDKVPKFIHYRPQSVILNSVEFDHADIYRDLEHVKQSFLLLLDLIPDGGVLVACEDEESIRDLLERRRASLTKRKVKVVTFGLERGDYQARDVKVVPGRGLEFSVTRKNKLHDTLVHLNLMGRYNVKNALASIALWETLGFPTEGVVRSLAAFSGVKRRQDILGTPNGITVIEDFAHHPTAVKETIRTVQEQFPQNTVFSIFEARSATSRRNVFQEEYADAFSSAQRVLFPPVFNPTGIAEAERFSMEKLLRDLRSKNVKVDLMDGVDAIVARVVAEARPGDAVLVMSNGGFDGIYQKLLTRLEAGK